MMSDIPVSQCSRIQRAVATDMRNAWPPYTLSGSATVYAAVSVGDRTGATFGL